jgi:hypothetical protein
MKIVFLENGLKSPDFRPFLFDFGLILPKETAK